MPDREINIHWVFSLLEITTYCHLTIVTLIHWIKMDHVLLKITIDSWGKVIAQIHCIKGLLMGGLYLY